MHLAASLQAVAHGSDSVLYFQLRQSQGASEKFHGAVIDHYGGDDTRVFREVTEVGEVLEQIQETVGTIMRSQAAVLYDRENDWAIADAQGPRNEDMHYQENVQKQYRALRRKGYNTDIISMEHDLSDYKLVTVPMAYMFYHGYAEKLRTFAENGGTLVISYWSGLVDETDKCFLGERLTVSWKQQASVQKKSMRFMTGKKTMYSGNRKSPQTSAMLYLQKSL